MAEVSTSYAQPAQLFKRATGKIRRIRGQHVRAAFDQMNAGTGRINGSKFAGKRVAADFCESSGELYTGGACAHHDEIQWIEMFPGRSLAFGQFESQQHAPANLQRVFNCLKSGCKRFPLIMAEIRVAGACRHDQEIVGNFEIGSLYHAALEVDPV